MKIFIKNSELSINPEQFLRSAGYGYIRDRRTGNDSFVRRLGSYHYPRLHMYIERSGDNIVFNLHLDQKQASYAGSHAHNAEYEGEIVEREISRLKSLLKQYVANARPIEKNDNALNILGQGDFKKDAEKEKNISAGSMQGKSWWKRLFS